MRRMIWIAAIAAVSAPAWTFDTVIGVTLSWHHEMESVHRVVEEVIGYPMEHHSVEEIGLRPGENYHSLSRAFALFTFTVGDSRVDATTGIFAIYNNRGKLSHFWVGVDIPYEAAIRHVPDHYRAVGLDLMTKTAVYLNTRDMNTFLVVEPESPGAMLKYSSDPPGLVLWLEQ